MKRRFIPGLMVLTVAGICLCLLAFKSGGNRMFQLAKNLDIFSAVVKELDLFYVDSIDANKMIREGIDEMLYGLDPYTVYYPEDDRDELDQMLKNSYGGIGSIISWNSKLDYSVINEPYEGMPADKAGLKAGDILLELDGKNLKGLGNEKVSEMLRGQIGTRFHLKVQRPGTKKPLEMEIVRGSIELPIIPYYTKMEQGVGYINLSTFSGKPSKEFRKAFLDLKKQGITSLVIDLRGNGGGLLDEAIEIANFFLPRGKVLVTTKGKSRQVSDTYKTQREPLDVEMPLAVLVSSATASSSEILAGSLQDLDRAVIIGTRTFGKGLVQTTRPLPYGGAMKLTTSKYYIPSGRCVQAIDYAHRNEDGSVGRIADSLTTVFHTAAGREVCDGGGILPDIVNEREKLPNILYYLTTDLMIFDYATQYCLQHPTIAAPEAFSLSDEEYEAFKAFVKEKDFKYDQQTEKMLKSLKELAQFEGYLETASAEFDALEQKLQHNLEHDLDYNARLIKEALCEEIVKRYYYQRGSIIEQLKEDADLKSALRVLTDPTEYRRILSVKEES